MTPSLTQTVSIILEIIFSQLPTNLSNRVVLLRCVLWRYSGIDYQTIVPVEEFSSKISDHSALISVDTSSADYLWLHKTRWPYRRFKRSGIWHYTIFNWVRWSTSKNLNFTCLIWICLEKRSSKNCVTES